MTADAEFVRPGLLRLDTDNVAAVTLTPPDALSPAGDELTVIWNGKVRTTTARLKPSLYLEAEDLPTGTIKHRGLEGSISDVITTPFIVVTGTSSADPVMRERCAQKAEAFAANWNTWQKVRPRVRKDAELTDDEKKNFSLILIGGPDANSVAKDLASALPLTIDAEKVTVDGRSWPVSDAVVQLVYPSPLAAERYVVLVAGTSPAGLYFWNPALWQAQAGYPAVLWDWTIQDGRRVTLPAGGPAEDTYVAAGIFNRSWRREDRTTVAGNADLRARSPLRHGPLAPDEAAKLALGKFAGTYELAPGVAAHVVEQNGKLALQLPGQGQVALEPEGGADFGSLASGASLHFEIGTDQSVTGFVANYDGRDTVFKRTAEQP
jgi:hypothetical protein